MTHRVMVTQLKAVFRMYSLIIWASQVVLVVKNLPDNAGDVRDLGSTPRWERSPGGRAQQPTLVFLPGESHGQRILVAYSSQGHTELDTTEKT